MLNLLLKRWNFFWRASIYRSLKMPPSWIENVSKFVGNKTKGRISKRMFQENKARQIFWKTNISHPLTRTHTCAYQGVGNVCFSENLAWFIFLKHPFWDLPFCLITGEFYVKFTPSNQSFYNDMSLSFACI